jgi:predicted transcriptional regulator
MTVKEIALDLIGRMPTRSTWDEVLYEIYVRKQLEAGLKDEEEGRLVPHEKVFAKYAKKRKKSRVDGKSRTRS